MTTRLPVGLFFALFTVSGFAGLIYESIWSHYLKLFLGHAAYAQTLVLAIFMGGMALGSWLVSRFTHRIGNLLLGYALAEIGIGLLAVAFHRTFGLATGWAFDTVLPALGGSGVDLFKWTLASLLILPASVLLGTTFPLMSAGIIRLYPETSGRALSMLYFTNSFGAAIGVLASGFWLIGKVGLPGTILVAGVLNVMLGVTVWGLSKLVPPVTVDPGGAKAPDAGASLGRVVLLLALFTGAASFIYEITWIRMLTLALGASTHSFEIMLSAFILAMSLGAFWFRDRIGRLRNDLAWLAGLLFAKALFAALALWVYPDVLELIKWLMGATAKSDGGYTLATMAGMAASMMLMFPTAFCAGMTLPLATHVLTTHGHGEASIGRVYGANTAGCILGAAFATHVGMEYLGLKGLTGVGALLDAGVGALVLVATGLAATQRRFAMASAGVTALALGLFAAANLDVLRMNSGVYRHGDFMDPARSGIVFHRDGKTATVAVIDVGGVRSIRTNGKSDAGIQLDPAKPASPDEYTMVMAAALPLAYKPEAKAIANIGFGSGLTTHVLLGSPRLEVLDTIEIERMMVEGSRNFHPRNARAYADPRSRVHIEDAKTFFAAHGKRYDVIVSEPSNPWVSGIATLFSEEFYRQMRRYLTDDGVLVQWIQSYEINVGLVSSIFQAMGRHFGDYAVYRTGTDMLVVATPARSLPKVSGQLFAYPAVKAELANLGLNGVEELRLTRLAGRRALEPFMVGTGIPANSDFFPILDQLAPRARFKGETATELAGLRNDLAPVLAIFDEDIRIPLERLSAGGKNRPLQVGNALYGAEALGVSMTGQAHAARVLQGATRSSATLVHGLMDGCDGAQDEWMAAILEVSRQSVPFIATADVAPFFKAVKASKCWKSLGDAARARVDLLEALSTVDVARIAAGVDGVLQQKTFYLDGERADYLASGIAANLVQDRLPQAIALRERWLPTLTPRDRSLALQLALSHLSLFAGSR